MFKKIVVMHMGIHSAMYIYIYIMNIICVLARVYMRVSILLFVNTDKNIHAC